MGNIVIGRLAYLILLPVVYEGIMYLMCRKLEYKKLFIAECIVDYIIIGVYVYNVYRLTGTLVFTDKYLEQTDSFGFFVIASVVYVVICIICTELALDMGGETELPLTHTIVLIVLFIIFTCMDTSFIQDTLDKSVYDNMEYNIETTEIKLRLMSDGHGVDGSVSGSHMLGSGYISGKIQDNYKIYYAYLGDNGETVIDSFIYSNESVDIFEQENCMEPKLIKKHYYKSYKTEYNSYSHEYYTYELYIPALSSEINLDLE